jgi:hypothetical protein
MVQIGILCSTTCAASCDGFLREVQSSVVAASGNVDRASRGSNLSAQHDGSSHAGLESETEPVWVVAGSNYPEDEIQTTYFMLT